MKNKRGALLFAPILVVFMVFGLIYAWSEITARQPEFEAKIGERQFGLINTYHLGERYLFYIDQSAKYSAYQGVYDLAKNGGCSFGKIPQGYRLWWVGSPTPGLCFPSADDSKNGLLDFFKNYLGDYLSSYPPTERISDISEAFELGFEGNNIVGTNNKKDLPIDLPEISTGSPGTYTINPSFRVNLENYDFLDYDEIRSMALEILDGCKNGNGDLRRITKNCVTEEDSKQIFNNQNRLDKNDNNLELSTCPDGREPFQFLKYDWELNLIVRHSIYGYCVESDNPLVYAYEEGDPTVDDSETLGLKKINYKFALPFEDLDCTTDFPTKYPSTPPNKHPDYDDLVGKDLKYGNVFSTGCKETTCGKYHFCDWSEDLCYCVDGLNVGGSKGDNECIGSCFPYCSTTPSFDVAIDKVDETRCTAQPCGNYMSCNGFNPSPSSEEMCACPVPGLDDSNQDPWLNRQERCSGNDCITLHCDRDLIPHTNPPNRFNGQNRFTQCRSTPCGDVEFCRSAQSVCGCGSGFYACEGFKGEYSEGCGGDGQRCPYYTVKMVTSNTYGCGSIEWCKSVTGCAPPPPPRLPTPPPQ